MLIDSDVFVDRLRGRARLAVDGAEVHFSTITRAELFAGSRSQEDAVRTLLAPFKEHAVDRDTAELGGAIRREVGIPLPDALIAATALRNGLAVATRNREHCERLDGLTVCAPS